MESKALGKGLSALIQNPRMEKSEGNISSLETKLIQNNRFQPRTDYNREKLEELKASIKEKGILQPIVVRPIEKGYEVVAGERRLRACRELGMEQVPVVVKNVTDREALVLALVENIQRQELNPIEEAKGFKRLLEEFNFTQESVASSVGKDRTTVTNLLRVLKLPQEIQGYVASGQISVGHARALLGLEHTSAQLVMAKAIIQKGHSVRQIEAMVKKEQAQTSFKEPKLNSKTKDRDIAILEEELSRLFGTKVIVDHKNKQGKVSIEYYSLDDLDRILGVIRK